VIATASLTQVGACGRLAFDPLAGPPDATVVSADADLSAFTPPLVSVDPTTLPPWGVPQLVVELSTPGTEDDDPALTRDMLEIVFDRGQDLYTSRRAAVGDPWPEPVPIVQLNTGATEEHPHISGDNLRLYFTSGRGGIANIYMSTRADRDAPWGAPARVDELNTDEYEAMGGSSADERIIAFSSQRGGLTVDDLYSARRAHDGVPWEAPVALAELNTPTYERSPHLDDHGLVMFFDQAASGRLTWTHRATTSDPWATAMTITELDDAGPETDPWLSPDLRTMYYVRNTGAGRDIYIVTR
jgi:hypothetical protein